MATAEMRAGELLLNWLTYVNEGSWVGFRRALAALTPDDNDGGPTAGRMMSHMSDAAYAEFFVGGTDRWRTFAPLIGGLCTQGKAVLCGGRTSSLINVLAGLCERGAVGITAIELIDRPDRVMLEGTPEVLRGVAEGAGVPYVPNLAVALCARLTPMGLRLESASPGAAPTNWSQRSFDLGAMRWVDGFLPDTAYEYRPRRGRPRHYVRGPRHRLVQLDRHEAIYAAALMNSVAILSYDASHGTLAVPWGAPLPDALARAATACAGMPAVEANGRSVYGDVPSEVAGVLMLAAGQRPPEPGWLRREHGAC